MVEKFGLIRTPKIVFGEGQSAALPDLMKNHGKTVLIITGARSYQLSPVLSNLFSMLERTGLKLYFDKAVTEPSPAEIDRMVNKYRPLGVDMVVAIGGGSVVDAGKAVSAMLPNEGSVRDYLEGVGAKTHPGTKKYFAALPTTAGTGSEATANAVISETGMHGFKRSLRHENIVPDVAIVDPGLTLACPAGITASSGMDAFTQLVESFLSVKSNPLIDAIALDGIKNIHYCLVKAVKEGGDIRARSGMAYAAMLSGISLSNAGLGLVHGFASAIGGLFPIPHGTVCGTLMGTVNRHNIEILIEQKGITLAHEKYAEMGRLLSGKGNKDFRWYMKYTADYIDELTESLQIKRLGEFGITASDLGRIAECTDHKANPVKFEKLELAEMLGERL